MKLKSIVFGAALFAAGVLASNRIRHAVTSFRASEQLPYVSVQYTAQGSFVNGQKVYENRIGEARCDWYEIEKAEREHLVMASLQEDRTMMSRYLRDSPGDDVRHIAYLSLAQLARRAGSSVAAEVDSMRTAIGYRWSMTWGQADNH